MLENFFTYTFQILSIDPESNFAIVYLIPKSIPLPQYDKNFPLWTFDIPEI